uniref:C2HC/C3H-type domain-containing protein n=1 Tax=Pyrodinium bahamense TaxID=73915 RepID=A0A7R9ZV83_9DINO|mmetsp:Transcript_10235/g.28614  ORF Transcript_10235/g.28614 Transcript_10235/m.28614 type:complete len:413 (+) Transcript_10235:83-1321(+)
MRRGAIEVPAWSHCEFQPRLPASVPLPPPGRSPSKQDVDIAQSHLVLLKSKLRQRRLHESSCQGGSAKDLPTKQPSSAIPDVDLCSRFQPITAVKVGGVASVPKGVLPGGRGRPREVQWARSIEHLPRGVTWDPPSTPKEEALTPRPEPSVAGRSDGGGYPGGPRLLDKPWVPVPVDPVPMTPASASHAAAPLLKFAPSESDDQGPVAPCPDCGRTFCKDSLAKHIKICKKVFQQKHKQFNSAAYRLGEFENAGELIANAQKLEREKPTGHPRSTQAVPKWKQKSLAFRQAILAAKAAAGDADAQMKADAIQQKLDAAGNAGSDMTQCPHCGRTFNKEAGERHIAICVKTFGSKPGGGRLVKGGGRVAAGATQKPTGWAPSLAAVPQPQAASHQQIEAVRQCRVRHKLQPSL